MPLRKPVQAWYPWVHLATYQATWFAAVLGGAAGLLWPGALAAGLALALHLALVADPDRCALRLLLATLIGIATDVALAATGMVHCNLGHGAVPPLWMIVLWPSCAALFDDLGAWVVRRRVLAAVLGALGGPLAYLGGAGLGALAFPAGTTAGLLAVAAAWTLAMVALVQVWRWRGAPS
jgi:hypothetical protein